MRDAVLDILFLLLGNGVVKDNTRSHVYKRDTYFPYLPIVIPTSKLSLPHNDCVVVAHLNWQWLFHQTELFYTNPEKCTGREILALLETKRKFAASHACEFGVFQVMQNNHIASVTLYAPLSFSQSGSWYRLQLRAPGASSWWQLLALGPDGSSCPEVGCSWIQLLTPAEHQLRVSVQQNIQLQRRRAWKRSEAKHQSDRHLYSGNYGFWKAFPVSLNQCHSHSDGCAWKLTGVCMRWIWMFSGFKRLWGVPFSLRLHFSDLLYDVRVDMRRGRNRTTFLATTAGEKRLPVSCSDVSLLPSLDRCWTPLIDIVLIHSTMFTPWKDAVVPGYKSCWIYLKCIPDAFREFVMLNSSIASRILCRAPGKRLCAVCTDWLLTVIFDKHESNVSRRTQSDLPNKVEFGTPNLNARTRPCKTFHLKSSGKWEDMQAFAQHRDVSSRSWSP